MEGGVLRLLLRSLEFGFYHSLLSVVDRVSKLPRNTTMPAAARLYRENDEIRERRLVRREYANGILRGYSLVTDADGPDAIAA